MGPLICRIQEVLESPNRSVAGRSDQNPKHGHTQERMNQHSITHASGLHTTFLKVDELPTSSLSNEPCKAKTARP